MASRPPPSLRRIAGPAGIFLIGMAAVMNVSEPAVRFAAPGSMIIYRGGPAPGGRAAVRGVIADGAAKGKGCLLDTAFMRRGSLLVVASDAGRRQVVLHWAGGPTAAPGRDCGGSDVAVSDTGLDELAASSVR